MFVPVRIDMTSSFVGDTLFGLDLSRLKTSYHDFRKSISKRILLVELSSDSITLAEAQLKECTIDFSHVRRFALPDDAIDRGIPNEPRKMAQLLKNFCLESAIPAHRAAVVIPNEAIFTTVIQIPASIEARQALDYALSPDSGVQVPIQLETMDADLIPLEGLNLNVDLRAYFLLAIPKKLVDRVLETLQFADLDLVQLQAGITAQLHHLISPINTLGTTDAILHLELNRDYTQLALVSSSGPVRLSRLTSIRNFPDPPDEKGDEEDLHKDAAARLISDNSYLPLTELDLKRLVSEVNTFILNSKSQEPHLTISEIYVSGLNSAHPALVDVLKQMLNLQVYLVRPLLSPGVGQFSLHAPLVLADVGRLVGLGLSLLPKTTHVPQSTDTSKQIHSTISQTASSMSDDSIIDVPFSMINSTDEISQSSILGVLERPLLPQPTVVEQDSSDPGHPVSMSPRSDADSDLSLNASSEPVPMYSPSSSKDTLIASTPSSSTLSVESSTDDQSLTSFHSQDPEQKACNKQELQSDCSTIFSIVDDAEVSKKDTYLHDDADSEVLSEKSLMQEPESSSSSPSLHLENSISVGESIPISASPIDLAEDTDEVPFSMEDLIQSFEQNHVESTSSSQSNPLDTEESLSSDTTHSMDDPTLWPSIPTDDDSSVNAPPS